MAKRLAPGAFHSAATFARGSRPRGSLPKSRRLPARGPLRGTGAACSRQATPGSAPASQWLAAVPAAREELDGVCRSAQAHRALRAGSWLPLGRCPSAPAAPAPVATPRSVPLALASGSAPGHRSGTGSGAGSSTSLPSALADRLRCGLRGRRQTTPLAPVLGLSRVLSQPARQSGPGTSLAPALPGRQQSRSSATLRPCPPQAPGIGSKWPRRGWARSAQTPRSASALAPGQKNARHPCPATIITTATPGSAKAK